MNKSEKWSCKVFKENCPVANSFFCWENNFFQASLNKLDMGIAVLDRQNLSSIFLNNRAKTILSIFQNAFLNNLREDLKRFFAEKRDLPVSGRIQCEEFFIGYTCYKLGDDFYIVFFRDITDRESIRLIHQNKMIYEKYNKIISEIIHEIGNPIAGIMNALQIIQINFDEYSKSEIGEKIILLLNETRRLKEILNLLRPLGSNSVSEWKRCNLSSFISDLVGNYTDRVSINLENIPKNWFAILREEDFKHIFEELVKNAEKFAGKNSEINIALCKKSPFYFKMVFEDNGPGISDELLEKIFSPFFTTSPKTSKGMGLTIARKRMLNMGGMIFAEHSKKGARFVLYIPVEDYIYELFGPVGG